MLKVLGFSFSRWVACLLFLPRWPARSGQCPWTSLAESHNDDQVGHNFGASSIAAAAWIRLIDLLSNLILPWLLSFKHTLNKSLRRIFALLNQQVTSASHVGSRGSTEGFPDFNTLANGLIQVETLGLLLPHCPSPTQRSTSQLFTSKKKPKQAM